MERPNFGRQSAISTPEKQGAICRQKRHFTFHFRKVETKISERVTHDFYSAINEATKVKALEGFPALFSFSVSAGEAWLSLSHWVQHHCDQKRNSGHFTEIPVQLPRYKVPL